MRRFLLALALVSGLAAPAQAAITLVGVAENQAVNGVDVTVTLPALAQDDVCYVAAGHGKKSIDVGVSTGGYTELSDTSHTGAEPSYRLSINRKVMGASPDASVTCTMSGDVLYGGACIAICLRGVDTTTPEDAATTTAEGNSTNPDNPAITTVTAGAWVLPFAGNGGTQDTAVTNPTNYVNQVHIASNDSNDSTIAGATREIASPTSENPDAWTAWTTGEWLAATVAVRPAGAAAACAPTLTLLGVGC